MSEYPKSDRFKHTVSRYERPTSSYRCGRAGLWGKPCSLGPNEKGECGGITACRPFKNGDRWECRRVGGACQRGPEPDGRCCHTQSACAPTPSLRRMRGRIALLALVLSIAVLALATIVDTQRSSTSATPSQVDAAGFSLPLTPSLFSPGELSDIHLAFTGEKGCTECHTERSDHTQSPGQTNNSLAALKITSLSPREDLQAGCVRCHEFGGPASAPHNQDNLAEQLQCQTCHTEHKGRFSKLTTISNAQCAQCHEQKFASFKSHAEFGERFPHRNSGNIVFDHAKHLDFHFDKAKDPTIVPATCTSCHIAEGAKSRVKIGGFDQSCAGCHQNNIVAAAKSELALLSLPKLKLKSDDEIAAFGLCGATPGKKFKAAGKGRSTAFQDWLLGSQTKQTAQYSDAFCQLLKNLESKNIDALVSAMQAKAPYVKAALFSGLKPETIDQLSSTWVNNKRYRPIKNSAPKTVTEFGWFIDSKGGLKYRATNHADPVAMAWVEFAQQLQTESSGTDDQHDALAVRLADQILADDGGLGACLKCHLPGQQTADKPSPPSWTSSTAKKPHHRFKFNHSAHLSFVGAGSSALSSTNTGCAVCHQLNSESNYAASVRANDPNAYSSNFYPLKTETCAQCHNEKSIKDDCTLCHQYHETPTFTQRLSATLGGNYAPGQQTNHAPEQQ